MYAVKCFFLLGLLLSTSARAQECSKIFDSKEVPQLETLERCRDFTERQARRFERPVFQTELEQDLIERLIYVVSKKETCYFAKESFFSSYGIQNRTNPEEDMGEELKRFWQVLIRACPELK